MPILISLCAFLLVIVFFFQARSNPFLPSLWPYWTGLGLILTPGILSSHRVATILSIGLFSFAQSFSYVLSAPYGIVFSTDPIYNFQAVTLLGEQGFWTVGWGSEQTILYSFYPGSTFAETALGLATGLPLSVAFMVATSTLRFAVLPIAFYKVARRFLKDKPSLIAAGVLFATPSYIFNLPVLQEFAIVFLVLALYAILLAASSNNRGRLSRPAMAAAVILLCVIATSHYFTAYIFAFFLGFLALASLLGPLKRRIFRRPKSQVSAARMLRGFRYAAPVYAVVLLTWSALVSNVVDQDWFQYGEKAMREALEPGSLDRPLGVGQGAARPGFTYSSLDKALIGGAILLWLAAAFLGALLIRRRAQRGAPRKATPARVLLALFVPCLLLVFVTGPLVFSQGFFIPLRVFEYAGLGLAPLMALSFGYVMVRKPIAGRVVIGAAVVVLVAGGSLLPLSNPRFYYIPPEAEYCAIPTHETPDVMEAALWAKQHIPLNTKIWGDELVYDVFGGYGQFTPYNPFYGGYELFNASTLNASTGWNFGLRGGDVIVVNAYLTSSICFASFRASPFPQAKLDKFAESPLMTRLFQNSEVILYRWEGAT